MAIRIGLMGFGRIGRNIFRILHGQKDMHIVAISDIMPRESMAYLLRWDTVHGPFADSAYVKNDSLFSGGREIKLLDAVAPGDADWRANDVEIVIEATAKYRKRGELQRHLDNGAKYVVLTTPPDDTDATGITTVVSGVNDAVVTQSTTMLSTGSVTVNAIAPILKIINEAYGIKRAAMTSVHAYTNAQRLADVPHTDFRASRSAVENIIPTTSASPRFIEAILPELKGKLQGIAMNVPVPDGSVVDMVTEMTQEVSIDQINNVIRSAAGSQAYANVVQYTEDAIVSSDVIGNTHSAIFDAQATNVLAGNLVKTLTWYDNGWGYACRVVELIKRLSGYVGAV